MFADVLAWAALQPEGSTALALYRAISTGALEVRNANGEMVRYGSAAEMQRILTALYSAGQPAASRRPRATIARIGA